MREIITSPATYSYDVENRLVGMGGSRTASLRYDPLGRLYEISGGTSGTVRFVHDGDALTLEYDGAGSLLRRYAHGADAKADDPVAWFEGAAFTAATQRALRPDWQGSIVLVTDSAGSNVLAVNRYDAYGIPQTTASAGRFQYTGQAWIPDIGMSYYKARIYSPDLGRFMQTDPIGYDDQINLYAYVGNDPVNKTDPTGTEGIVDDAIAWGQMVVSDLGDLASGIAHGEFGWAFGNMPPTVSGGANVVTMPIRAANALRIATTEVKTGSTIARNAAQGAKGEAQTAARLGERVAGRRVTLESSSTGRRSVSMRPAVARQAAAR